MPNHQKYYECFFSASLFVSYIQKNAEKLRCTPPLNVDTARGFSGSRKGDADAFSCSSRCLNNSEIEVFGGY